MLIREQFWQWRAGVTLEKVIGLGIGVGGVVEQAEQVSAYIAGWGWQNVPFVTLLEEHLHMPIYLDNAAKAMALAESLFGAGQGVEHLGHRSSNGALTERKKRG